MQQHVEEHDLSDGELEESYWLVTHWRKIEKYVIIAVLVFDIVLGLFVVGSVVKMYGFEYRDSKNLVSQLKTQIVKSQPETGIIPLASDSLRLIERKAQTFDIVSRIANQNARWRVNADLILSVDGKDMQSVPFFLYPKETKYVMKLGVVLPSTEGVTSRVENVSWRYVTEQELSSIVAKRQFETSDFQFIPFDGATASRLVFKFKNTGTYDFWEVPLSVILLSQGEVRGVNHLSISNVSAGETKIVYVPWFGNVPPVNMYEVIPEVDVFNDSVFRPSKEYQQKF